MDLQSLFWQADGLLCSEHLGPLLPLWTKNSEMFLARLLLAIMALGS